VRDLPGEGLNGDARVEFSPDGRWLVSGTARQYRFYEVGSWQPGRIHPRERAEFSAAPLAFAPDSKIVAILQNVRLVQLIDVATGQELASLASPDPRQISHLAFSPDGSRLTAACADAVIQVWDLRYLRHQLADLGLDWDLLPYPPAKEGEAPKPRQVQIILGDLREESLRAAIEQYKRAVENNPNNARACNNLAWIYATGPEKLRAPDKALPLAQKAVELAPENAGYCNTLGVVHYRLGRYKDAVEALERGINNNKDVATAFDLYFLAMCHHRLGDPAKAKDCYDRAVVWHKHAQLQGDWEEELNTFRAEAETLLNEDMP
jgi:tetratricopeptide (TPR) repeat protein